MANETIARPETPGMALTAPVQSVVPAIQDPQALPAIVRRNVQVLRPIADAVVLVQVQQESRELIAKLLKDGKDYGVVPGVKKPSLFKPGAEKFNAAYGLVARFTVEEKEIDHYKQIDWTKVTKEWSGKSGHRRCTDKVVNGTSFGLYRYVINCELIDRATGEVVGSSLGSCSTLESKYVDRPRDLENTVIKMAEKRAYIGATLLTHGLSEQFTQDVEDTGVASDDTQAIAAPEPDPGPPPAEVGSAEWAIGFEIPSGVHKGMKLPEDVKTFGQLAWPLLDAVIAGMERISTMSPEKKEACALVIRAARRMQDELEERQAMVTDAGDTGAAAANPTQGAAPTAPISSAGASAVASATPATSGYGKGETPFNPLKADGGGVPEGRPQTADGLAVDDDLPF